MKTGLFALPAVLLLLAGCSGDTMTGALDDDAAVTATTSNGAAGKTGVKMVPLKGEATGGLTSQAPHPDCPGATVIRSTGEGTGTLTHLGLFTWTSSHCFNYATGAFYDGHVWYVTANGDELYSSYEGYLTGPNTWYEQEVFDGGTGRFEHATGWLDGIGENTGTNWYLTFDGMISSVGSSK